eukprot:m.245690 g.245690  ORF g.245690 m.245690 type:complete len:348 (-) comp16109_c1_seq15:13-1056(-)
MDAHTRVQLLEESFTALQRAIKKVARRIAISKGRVDWLGAQNETVEEPPLQPWPKGSCGGAQCFRRVFVMPCHRSCPQGDFVLDGMMEGRMDLVARCLSQSLFISFDVRRNTDFRISLFERKKNSKQLTRTVIANGATAKHLRPEERWMGLMLQRRLQPFNLREISKREKKSFAAVARSRKCLVGIGVDDIGLRESLMDAILNIPSRSNANCNPDSKEPKLPVLILVLDEAAPLIDDPDAGWLQHCNNGVITLLGDNRGLNESEEAMLDSLQEEGFAKVVKISLGPTPLLASQCIVLMHHYLDKLVHTCIPRKAADVMTTGVRTPVHMRGQQCLEACEYTGWTGTDA